MNSLYDWCTKNYLPLNINKCQIMTFTRSRSTTYYNCFINNLSLLRSYGPLKDLGILFDPKLKFDCHIHMIINKSHKLLGFINRSCSDFTDKFTLKSIFLFVNTTHLWIWFYCMVSLPDWQNNKIGKSST